MRTRRDSRLELPSEDTQEARGWSFTGGPAEAGAPQGDTQRFVVGASQGDQQRLEDRALQQGHTKAPQSANGSEFKIFALQSALLITDYCAK